jgi:hypothetical protein
LPVKFPYNSLGWDCGKCPFSVASTSTESITSVESAQEFSDYQEVVSVNERNTKINVLTKSKADKNQDIIFIGLDEDNKLTIINITGKIDFHAISKLSDSLSKEAKTDENPDEEEKSKINK